MLIVIATRTLLEAAEKLKWPMKVDYAAAKPEDRKAFEAAFYNLVRLQSLGERIRSSPADKGSKEGLYPIQALVQAIALRFKFHFEGTRQTNRLDKVSFRPCSVCCVLTDRAHSLNGTSLILSTSLTTIARSWSRSSRACLPPQNTVKSTHG